MKIIVTGGAGFIGSHTVVELINNGYEPIIIDDFRNAEPFVIDQIEKITGIMIKHYPVNCGDVVSMNQIFKKEKPEGVIHFAADKAVGESVENPLKYFENNISNLIQLLKVVDQFELKSFVFSSSCTVYGNPDTIPVVESTPTKPAFSPYGETKQMGEKILLDYFKNKTICNLSLLRYFNPIGAHSSGKIGELPLGVPNNLVPFIMQTAIGKREVLTVFGNDYDTPDGYCIRDYIHVVDLADAHVLTLKYGMKKDHNPLILNVGIGKGHSVLEVIETFKREVGVKLNFKIGNRRAGDVPSIYADNKKIVALLGWKPRYSLADALVHAWKWEQEMKKHIG